MYICCFYNTNLFNFIKNITFFLSGQKSSSNINLISQFNTLIILEIQKLNVKLPNTKIQNTVFRVLFKYFFFNVFYFLKKKTIKISII